MRKYIIGLILGMILAYSSTIPGQEADRYVRDRVFLLHVGKAGCTGVQVYAPSGRVYMLSAAHCASLMPNGKTLAQSEAGKDTEISVVMVDKKNDLLLLTAVSNKALRIADTEYKHEKIYTMTHGALEPSHRTDGEILRQEKVGLVIGPIMTPKDLIRCLKEDDKVETNDIGIPFCIHFLDQITTTAKVRPGSSGGPVLDYAHNLVGVVSNYDRVYDFSGVVPLVAIKNLLKDK